MPQPIFLLSSGFHFDVCARRERPLHRAKRLESLVINLFRVLQSAHRGHFMRRIEGIVEKPPAARAWNGHERNGIPIVEVGSGRKKIAHVIRLT